MPYRQTNAAGHPALSLYNDDIELIALPGVGARIAYLRRRAGREWLWRNPRLPFLHPPLDLPAGPTAYVDRYDSGGWDECFPSIASSPVPGAPAGTAPIPDHGELWCAPWELDVVDAAGVTSWRARTRCRTVPAAFAREVRVPAEGSAVEFHYRLESVAEAPFAFLWAAHPLFISRAGTTVELPGVSRARVGAVHGRHDVGVGQEVAWPVDGGAWFTMPESSAWALKLFADAPPGGRVVLTDPTGGEALELQWDPREIPHVGLWLNAGGWAGPGAGADPYRNIAIEPCLGAPDHLEQAVEEWRVAPILRPGEVRTWRLTVLLRDGET
jgi:galactose mutarotase-like enzyme